MSLSISSQRRSFLASFHSPLLAGSSAASDFVISSARFCRNSLGQCFTCWHTCATRNRRYSSTHPKACRPELRTSSSIPRGPAIGKRRQLKHTTHILKLFQFDLFGPAPFESPVRSKRAPIWHYEILRRLSSSCQDVARPGRSSFGHLTVAGRLAISETSTSMSCFEPQSHIAQLYANGVERGQSHGLSSVKLPEIPSRSSASSARSCAVG